MDELPARNLLDTGRRLGFAAGILACLGLPAWAERSCVGDAMIVFDGSGSMAEVGFNLFNEPRIFDARKAMAEVIPDIAAARRLGLVIYGPGGADECTGIDLRFPPREKAAGPILDAVDDLQPVGSTPLTEAVDRAVDVLGEQGGEVVLVTDGKETCGGAPCRLAADLAGQGITVHVIGFRIRGSHFSWSAEGQTDYNNAETVSRCLAEQTDGEYVRAESLEELIGALRVTLGCNVLM